MPPRRSLVSPWLPLGCLALCLLTPAAHAERADRDQPVKLEAARVSVDDLRRVHVFEGNVVLTQGSLVIRSEKLVVTQDAEGFQKGIASGGSDGLARFRQKREAKADSVEGEAEQIEYDARTEKAAFLRRAHIKSGLDEVHGDAIHYDGLSEQYLVTATPSAKPGAPASRVTATIQPKAKKAVPAQ